MMPPVDFPAADSFGVGFILGWAMASASVEVHTVYPSEVPFDLAVIATSVDLEVKPMTRPRQHVHLIGQREFDRSHRFAACGLIRTGDLELVDLDEAERVTCGHCRKRVTEARTP